MYFSSWVIIEESIYMGINIKQIALKKNNDLRMQLITIVAFINPALDL